jgi:hypothetical protein
MLEAVVGVEGPGIIDPGQGDTTSNKAGDPCWVPVMFYLDIKMNYYPFLDKTTAHENPPGLIINLENSYESFLDPVQYQNSTFWVANCPRRVPVLNGGTVTCGNLRFPN